MKARHLAGNLIFHPLRGFNNIFMPHRRNVWLRRHVFMSKSGFQVLSLTSMYRFKSRIGLIKRSCTQCAKQYLVRLKGLILLLLNSILHSCTSSQLLLAAITDKLQTFWLTMYFWWPQQFWSMHWLLLKHCVTEIISFAESWDWEEGRVSLMKMSCLFLLCHSTRSGYIPQEGYYSSSLNKNNS